MKPDEIAFVADMMVGRLARWLRIFGYDTLYDPQKPVRQWIPRLLSENRVLLTRNRQIESEVPPNRYFWVEPNQPDDQIREVVRAFDLDTNHFVFSRCLLCNEPVVPVEKKKVVGKVPPRVWETQNDFQQCPVCGRVYWKGSHLQRVLEHIRKIFSDSPKATFSVHL